MTNVMEEAAPGRAIPPIRSLLGVVGLIALLFATGSGFFLKVDRAPTFAVSVALIVVTAAWIGWRGLNGLAWLAMIPAAIMSFINFAAALSLPWYGIYTSSSPWGLDPETGLFTSVGPDVPDLIMDSLGRLLLIAIMAAICIAIAEGIHKLPRKPAPVLAPVEVPGRTATEVLKHVGTTEDGKPLYVMVDGPEVIQSYRAVSKTNTLAILALVLGLVSGLPGIVLGHIALGQIKRTGESGRGMAIAGLVLGYVWAGFVAFYVMLMSLAAGAFL